MYLLQKSQQPQNVLENIQINLKVVFVEIIYVPIIYSDRY